MTTTTPHETLAELIDRMRGLPIDHAPDGWPAVRTREITALLDYIEELEIQLSAIGAGGVEPLRCACLHKIAEPAAKAENVEVLIDGVDHEVQAPVAAELLRLHVELKLAPMLDAKDRECLAVGRALNRAALDLPDDGEIRISIENGAGTVYVLEPKHGDWKYIDSGGLFSEQINEAIDAAIAAAKGEQQ